MMTLWTSFIIRVIVVTLVPLIINIWYALYRLGIMRFRRLYYKC